MWIDARRLLLGAALALGAPLAGASSGVEQLRSFLAQTQSASGEFSQTVERNGKRAAPPSSGSFVFQRPGKFRWVYEKPYEQVLVADGQRLYLYDKDLNQVTVKKLAAALPASPASILFGGDTFERDFAVKDEGAREGLAWVVATPKEKDTAFERISIGFRDGVPAAMQVKDSFGQLSSITFNRFERNPKVDPALLSFTPPKGADVLQDR